MRAGRWDHVTGIQAFTRHRIAAEERGARWGIEGSIAENAILKAAAKEAAMYDYVNAFRDSTFSIRALDPKTICDRARETDRG